MRVLCGPYIGKRRRRMLESHIWFAWYPVRVSDYERRWLELVDRVKVKDFPFQKSRHWRCAYRARRKG